MFNCSLSVSRPKTFAFLCNIPIKQALTEDERTQIIAHLRWKHQRSQSKDFCYKWNMSLRDEEEELCSAWSRGTKTTREAKEEKSDILADVKGAPSFPKPELENVNVSIVSKYLTSSIGRRDVLIIVVSSMYRASSSWRKGVGESLLDVSCLHVSKTQCGRMEWHIKHLLTEIVPLRKC